MAQNGKLRPNLDQQSTKLLNLTVLQRIDPFIDEILITATHVTFYEFNTDLSEWVCFFIFLEIFLSFSDCILLIFCGFSNFQSRKDVEGSLFVVKRWFSLYYVDGFWIAKFGVVCFGVNFFFQMGLSFLLLLFQECSTSVSVYRDESPEYWLVCLHFVLILDTFVIWCFANYFDWKFYWCLTMCLLDSLVTS